MEGEKRRNEERTKKLWNRDRWREKKGKRKGKLEERIYDGIKEDGGRKKKKGRKNEKMMNKEGINDGIKINGGRKKRKGGKKRMEGRRRKKG